MGVRDFRAASARGNRHGISVKAEALQEIHRVTDRYETGEIRASEFVRDIWIPLDVEPVLGVDEFLVNKSTDFTGPLFRNS